MIKALERFSLMTVELPSAVEPSEKFLLFGIDTQYGHPEKTMPLGLGLDKFELLISLVRIGAPDS